MAADGFQEIEIDLFRRVLGAVRPRSHVAVDRPLLLGGPVGSVVCAGSAYELEDLLGDAVLIDGERYASVADECEPELFFLDPRRCRAWGGGRGSLGGARVRCHSLSLATTGQR